MRTIDYMCQHLSSGVANHAVLERRRLQRARKELSLPVWVSSEYELSALYYNNYYNIMYKCTLAQ